MTDDRRDPEIVVFGVDDPVWGDSSGSHGSPHHAGPDYAGLKSAGPDYAGLNYAGLNYAGLNYAGLNYAGVGSAAGNDRPDEIRQGDDPERQRRPVPAGLARMRDRIVVGGRRLPPRQIAVAVASLIVVAFVAGVLVGHRSSPQVAAEQNGGFISFTPGQSFLGPTFRFRIPPPDTGREAVPETTAGPRVTVASSAVYALQLKATPVNQSGQSVETHDAAADRGPWSVIVRRSDGSLGRHGAVVTYPVSSVTIGPAIRVGVTHHPVLVPSASCVGRTEADCVDRTTVAVTGHVDEAGGIVWPVNGKFARIRGDVGRSALATLAARVSIRGGHPAMTAIPAGYRVIVSEPYRAPVVTQSRYTDSLRVDSGPIDGFIYSGVVIKGASFEEALYSETSVPAGNIGGHPAIRSPVGGGNATLAWEVAPGIVALVGYSGRLRPYAAAPSLTELARGGQLLGHAQWAATHPLVILGENYYS